MEEREKEQIAQWEQAMETGVDIRLVTCKDPSDEVFETFCRELSAAVPRVRLTVSRDSDLKMPEIRISDRVIFSALPHEKSLVPFLKALEYAASGSSGLDRDLREQLAAVSVPARMTLYIAAQCPHCPGVLETLLSLAAECRLIRLHVIEANRFTDKAAEDHVLSAPCLILDDDFRWTGAVSRSEIIDCLVDRDPAAMSAGALKGVLEDGNADWITRAMIQHGDLFPAFVELVVHPVWSVRLGAMVVIEALAEEAPELALALTDPLASRYGGADFTVKGDILYAMGEAGDRSTEALIRRLSGQETNEEIRAAADEAVDSIRARADDAPVA